jgi:hypothetical protein
MAKFLRRIFCVLSVCLLACFILIYPAISAESANQKIPLNQYGIRSTNPYVVDRFVDENGKSIDKIIVPGSPHPPAGFVRESVANLLVPNISRRNLYYYQCACSEVGTWMLGNVCGYDFWPLR